MRSLFCAAALLMSVVPYSSGQTPRIVAATGQPAPGGGRFNSLGSLPAVVSPGRVAFTATLSDVPTPALFADSATGVRLLARQADLAPNGFAYTFDSSPAFSANNGRVAFMTGRQNLNIPMAAFRSDGSSTVALAQRGQAIPSDQGELFNFTPAPTINPSGQVAFTAFVRNNDDGAEQGMFIATPGELRTIALDITPAPGGGFLWDFSEPAINASGQVAFFCRLYNDVSEDDMGVFAGPIGGLQQLARTEQVAPAGGTYREFQDARLNNAGDVVFFASLSGAGALEGIFAGRPGSVSAVAIDGAAAPGGGVFGSLSFAAINGRGEVAFVADVQDGPTTSAVFFGRPGNIQPIARVGDPTPDGATYALFDKAPATNSRGDVLFTSVLSGSEVNSTNDYALYAGRPGALRKIVRTGEQFDLDPGPAVEMRTVYNISFRSSGGEDGFGQALSEDGTIALWLQFRDDGKPDARAIAVSVLPDSAPALLGVRSRKAHGS